MSPKKAATLAVMAFALAGLLAYAKDKDNDKASATQMVDSGSFGIFVNGRRLATETFSIRQAPTGSVIKSEFHSDAGSDVQNSELQLNRSGELQRYEWKEMSPVTAQLVVLPNDNFLVEKVSGTTTEKPVEQPFMLPASTSILDDYFFVHREVLAWKFLAVGCRQQNGQVECPTNQKTQFGTLDPHTRSSMAVSMEFSGKEKVTIRGADLDLNRFNLKTENGDWSLWLDNQFKLVRIVVASENTEVVRD